MKSTLILALVASISLASLVPGLALARKEYNDVWTETYIKDSKSEELKKLAGEAKCNVCHIAGANKKERNPYGVEAAKNFKAGGISKSSDKKDIAAAFKKLEEVKAKDGKTFGEKIMAGQLPGGDKDGK